MFVSCQCQGWCQCCYYVDINLIISPTAWLKFDLKIKQHKGKFFQHRRVYIFITDGLTSLSVDSLKILLCSLLRPCSPQQKAPNPQQYNPRTHISLHYILLGDDWFSLGLCFSVLPSMQHEPKNFNIEADCRSVDLWMQNLRQSIKKISFPEVLGIKAMTFSVMFWVRVSCHASN